MTEHDDFFERLRADARPLRYQPSGAELARIRARILATIERPTVMDTIAAWFRPLLAGVAAVAAVAVFALTQLEPASEVAYESVEVTMAGDSYRVGE